MAESTGNAAGVALVSGGSRGIGRAVVRRLALDGYDVSFCYRSDEAAARDLEDELAGLGRRTLARRVDVRDATAVRDWVRETVRTLGSIDALVTSAAITGDAPVVSMRDADWGDVLDVNLGGVYHVCRPVVFDMMKRRSGAIVTLSSVVGVHGHRGQANYAASKAGIIAFTRSLAQEVGGHGIRANAVAPGVVDTDMSAALGAPALEEAANRIALRRLGRPEEVADLVSFLVSDRAGYITGTVVHIDGGIAL